MIVSDNLLLSLRTSKQVNMCDKDMRCNVLRYVRH